MRDAGIEVDADQVVGGALRRDQDRVGALRRGAQPGPIEPSPVAREQLREPFEREVVDRHHEPLIVVDRRHRGRVRRVHDVGIGQRRRERRPTEEVPRRIQRADRAWHWTTASRRAERVVAGSAGGTDDRNGTSSSAGSFADERRTSSVHVRPDPAGRLEPQLVDVERDLHLEASTHRHPPGPTVAACAVPGSRSNRSPARSSTSPSSVWNTIDPARQKSTLW